MKQSITEEQDYGCGVACFAFVCNMTFKQAVTFLDRQYSVRYGWRPSDLVAALNRYGFSYKNHYVRKKHNIIYPDDSIVLIERSVNYPVDHYLVFVGNKWMDPWINLPKSNNLALAQLGFRDELPSNVM